MAQYFPLYITYQGKQREFEAQLLHLGYLHKVQVEIDGVNVMFEPDEERNYRALVSEQEVEKSKTLSIGLLQAIAEKLQTLPEAGA
jgi:hypothetical protein